MTNTNNAATKTREYTVIFDRGPTSWGASVPDLPGCFAVGKTFDEVQQRIREAIEFRIEGLLLDGQPIPEPTTRSGSVTVSVPAAA